MQLFLRNAAARAREVLVAAAYSRRTRINVF